MANTRNNTSAQTHEKNAANVIGGLKAAMHNPNVSDEAKQHAAERLEEMGASVEGTTTSTASGYSSGEYITKEDINYAREILEAAGYHVERSAETTEAEHQTRVLAGYKAAMHNPNVSKEAKEHARQYLKEHGAI
ncbi:hypothetical protein ONZ45_g19658 [Pleurotus djamor]|nr:hypothetical protein ONZ45_g19658 [Pleurotus djamor]